MPDWERLERLATGGPEPAAAGQLPPRTIGPPEEYFADPRLAGFDPFREGDQYAPAWLPPEDRARVQAKMNAAGLFGTEGFVPGVWRPQDADAYKLILETANARGIKDAEQALDMFAAEQRVTSPKAKAPRAPLVTQYADPEAVRQVIRRSSLEMLGQRLSDDEERRIMSAYQSYTAQSQLAEYAATNPEGAGGSFTAPMSAEMFAESQIEATQPRQLGAQRYLDAFGEITKSLGTLVEAPRTTSGGGVA